MAEGLQVHEDGGVLTVVFDRPRQRNAMTFAMYEGLHEACERAEASDAVRVLVLRGAGGEAFVAGTDIRQFAGFTGEDGVEYERRIARVVDRLEDCAVPTVAVVQGWCVGGGLAIAAACDLRLATASSRFSVPIARTLGNTLSVNTTSLLVAHLGPARTLDVLLRARMLTGEEALAAGFVAELADDGEALDEVGADVVARLQEHAPLTMLAAKRAVARIRRATLPDGDDLVRMAFGSEDFAAAVAAFGSGERPTWRGR